MKNGLNVSCNSHVRHSAKLQEEKGFSRDTSTSCIYPFHPFKTSISTFCEKEINSEHPIQSLLKACVTNFRTGLPFLRFFLALPYCKSSCIYGQSLSQLWLNFYSQFKLQKYRSLALFIFSWLFKLYQKCLDFLHVVHDFYILFREISPSSSGSNKGNFV